MPQFMLEINGIEREVALPTLSVQHVVNGPDILEGDIQDELGSIALSMDDIVVLTRTDVSPQTTYFAGLLQTVGDETWTGWGYSRLRKITAFDYSVYASFVQATVSISTGSPTDSLSSFLSTLISDYLGDYGVTLHPSQATGPTLEPNAWDGQYIEAILNSVSEQIGWVWKVDEQNRLRMWDPATEAAGFNVTATNDAYVEDIKKNRLRQKYYNRVFIEGGSGYQTFINETHFGDGSTRTFEMNAPMHYYEVDYTASLGFMVGLQLEVHRTGGVTIEYANDQLTAQWTFNRGPDYSLTQVSGATLGPTEYILINAYSAQYPFRLVSDGRGSPPAPARDLKLVRPTIFGRTALQAIADQFRTASQIDFERIGYPTDEMDIRPGQTQTVNVPEAGVNGTYTAINCRLAYVSGGDTSEFRLEVTAVNAVTARSFWLNLYDRWLTDTQGSAASPAVLTPVVSTPVPVAVVPATVTPSGLIGYRHITTAGAFTYTPSAGTRFIIAELIGAGGGSSGVAAPSASQINLGGAGGAGAWGRVRLVLASLAGSLSGSVGAGGTAGSSGNNNGGAGGNTTLTDGTTTWTAGGGSGGTFRGSSAAPCTGNGTGGGSLTGTFDDSRPGNNAAQGFAMNIGQGESAAGASTIYGRGGNGRSLAGGSAAGIAGEALGGGAGAAVSIDSGGGNRAGAAGGSGGVIIWEYR